MGRSGCFVGLDISKLAKEQVFTISGASGLLTVQVSFLEVPAAKRVEEGGGGGETAEKGEGDDMKGQGPKAKGGIISAEGFRSKLVAIDSVRVRVTIDSMFPIGMQTDMVVVEFEGGCPPLLILPQSSKENNADAMEDPSKLAAAGMTSKEAHLVYVSDTIIKNYGKTIIEADIKLPHPSDESRQQQQVVVVVVVGVL
eukprot:jgi/Bigna1/132894/aug1.19_g7602